MRAWCIELPCLRGNDEEAEAEAEAVFLISINQLSLAQKPRELKNASYFYILSKWNLKQTAVLSLISFIAFTFRLNPGGKLSSSFPQVNFVNPVQMLRTRQSVSVRGTRVPRGFSDITFTSTDALT